MSLMRCNNIKPEYNGTVFKIKRTLGDIVVPRTSHGIYTRPIPEGYYMNRDAVKKPNPIINLFVRMYQEMKAVIAEMKPDVETRGEFDVIHKEGGIEEVL